MLYDSIEVFFVLIFIIKTKSNTWSSKSTSSSNSMEIGCTVSLHLILNLMLWNIEINYKLSFRDINTSRDQICANQNMDLLLSEFFHSLISFIFWHFREHDLGCKTVLHQFFVKWFSIVFSVYEDKALSRFACFKNVFNEINFFTRFAFHDTLFNMIKR